MDERTPRAELVFKLSDKTAKAVAVRGLLSLGPDTSPLARVADDPSVIGIGPLFGSVSRDGRVLMSSDDRDDPLQSLQVITLRDGRRAEEIARDLARDDRVEWAHVPVERVAYERRRSPAAASATHAIHQWGLHAIGWTADIGAGATDTTIAIIDTGADRTHPDLRGVIHRAEIFGDGDAKDTNGHGTHVAGIIAARAKTHPAVRGVCSSARIVALKALDPFAGSGYYRALWRAWKLGARVVNLSLGGGEDPTERYTIKKLQDRGVIFVAAMGNDYENGNPTAFPANLPGVIAVAALDELDRRATFSNTGRHCFISAPGVNVVSTVPTWPSECGGRHTHHAALAGTSMATPFVTAAVALLLAKRPGATSAQIRRALRRGAVRLDGQRGRTPEHGYGRLHLARTLAAMP